MSEHPSAGPSRGGSNEGEEQQAGNHPRRKKRTKTSIACEACQTRKSRCELVTERGCHRCTVLGTACSLQGQISSTSGYEPVSIASSSREPRRGSVHEEIYQTNSRSREPSLLPDATNMVAVPNGSYKRGRSAMEDEDLQDIRKRTMDIQNMMRSLVNGAGPGGPSFSNSSGANPLPLRSSTMPSPAVKTEELEIYGKVQQEGPIGIASITLGIAGWGTFLDPVEAGIVLPRQMDEAYATFVSIFQSTLPLHRLTCNSRTAPKHPFLRTCILYFLACTGNRTDTYSPATRHMIFRMAEQNISQTSFSRPEVAVAEGLVIVSLAPSRLSEKSLVFVDPYQAGALALEFAKRLGLDDSMYVVPREIGCATLDQWDTTPALNRLCLWFSALHRQTWLNIVAGSGSMLDYISMSAIPTALNDRYHINAWYHHLKFESQLLDLVLPVVKKAQVVRTCIMWNPSETQDFEQAYEHFKVACEMWRKDLLSIGLPTQSILVLSSIVAEFALVSRIATDTSLMFYPPTHPDIILPHIRRYGGAMCAAASKIVKHVATWKPDLNYFPAYLTTFTLLSFATLSQVHSNQRTEEKTDDLFQGLPVIEELLRATHLGAGHTIDRLKTPMPITAKWGDALSHLDNYGSPVNGEVHPDLRPPQSNIPADMPFIMDVDWFNFFASDGTFDLDAVTNAQNFVDGLYTAQ